MKIYFVRIFISVFLTILGISCSQTLQAQVELTINNPANIAGTYTNISIATFGPHVAAFGQITGDVVASDDIEGCNPFINAAAVMGNLALIDRGSCQFQQKTGNAQAAGAIAVIICLVDDSEPFTMGGTNDTLTIPAIMITKALCDQIRVELPTVNVTIGFVSECIDIDVDDGCPNTDDGFDPVTCEIFNVSNCPIETVLDDNCTCVNVCFDETQNIIASNANGTRSIYSIDLDGDGDNDVLSGFFGKVVWFSNDGEGNFSGENIISTDASIVQSVYSTDLDGDSDNDVLSASQSGDKIAWYANNGQGNFSSENIISSNTDGTRSVYSIDLDGDGDNDVLSASFDDDKIAWYANDGQGNFSTENIISTNADGARSVYSTDLDGDGDNDVLSASQDDDKIAWYANNGQGNFSTENIISTNADGAYSTYSIDLDGDGDNDVLSASLIVNKVVWYDNDGQGNFNNESIIDINIPNPVSIYSIDLDGDGDNDVLSASSSFSGSKVIWYANDGQGNFGGQNTIFTNTSTSFAAVIYSIDLDGDGDNDVLSAGDNKIAWYENLCSIAVSGCTNPDACNFDGAATTDDGSCFLPGDTCDDGNPLTNNDTVQQADCSCQGDIVDGGVVPTVGEWGLIILALILLNLGVLYIRQTEIRIEEA